MTPKIIKEEANTLELVDSCTYHGRLIELKISKTYDRYFFIDGGYISKNNLGKIVGLTGATIQYRVANGHKLSDSILPVDSPYWAKMAEKRVIKGAEKTNIGKDRGGKLVGDRTPLQGAELFSAKWLRVKLLPGL